MKRIMITAMAAIAALACMASIGVSAAFAGHRVVLCKEKEEPCASANVYPEGSPFTGEATASSDQLQILTTVGSAVKCGSSTIKGTVGPGTATGQTISFNSWEQSSCTNPLVGSCKSKVEGLPYNAEVNAGGDMKFTNPQLYFDCGGAGVHFKCTYSEELLSMFGGYLSFRVEEEPISQSGPSCEGEFAHLSVTYRMTAPGYPLYPSWRPMAPQATTEAADHVRVTQATLHGTVNPEGEATNYWFECGKTTAYGTKVPATPKEAGSGASNVAVSETYSGLEPSTTYHCRVVAEDAAKEVSNGEDISFHTEPELCCLELAEPQITDPFDGGTASLTNFASNFSALGWAGGATPKGSDASTGWKSTASYPTVNGAYYTPSFADVGWGVVGTVKLKLPPVGEGRYVSLWIDMPTSGSTKAGYQLRVQWVSSGHYSLTLSKWVGGTQTELASEASRTFSLGSSVALSDQGQTVAAWLEEHSSNSFEQVLSATDASFEGGRIGIEAVDPSVRLSDFRASAVRAPSATTEAASEVKATSATLNGTVNPTFGGSATSYWFEYGTTAAYGTNVPTTPKEAGSGASNAVKQTLSGLTSATTYHFRLVAESEAGRTYGADKTLTTP